MINPDKSRLGSIVEKGRKLSDKLLNLKERIALEPKFALAMLIPAQVNLRVALMTASKKEMNVAKAILDSMSKGIKPDKTIFSKISTRANVVVATALILATLTTACEPVAETASEEDPQDNSGKPALVEGDIEPESTEAGNSSEIPTAGPEQRLAETPEGEEESLVITENELAVEAVEAPTPSREAIDAINLATETPIPYPENDPSISVNTLNPNTLLVATPENIFIVETNDSEERIVHNVLVENGTYDYQEETGEIIITNDKSVIIAKHIDGVLTLTGDEETGADSESESTTYSYEAALAAFSGETDFGKAIRYETAEFDKGELPEYSYTVVGDQAIKVDVTNPDITVKGGRLFITLTDNSELMWNEINGWSIKQFSTNAWGGSDEFATFYLDIEHLNRDSVKEQYPAFDDDKITPILGLQSSKESDIYSIRDSSNPVYRGLYQRQLVVNDDNWYSDNDIPLKNSPLVENPADSAETIDAIATTAFSIMWWHKAEVTDAELIAVKNYTFGTATAEDISLLTTNDNFASGSPLSVETNKGPWILNQGLNTILTPLPEGSNWYKDIGLLSDDPFTVDESGKATVVIPSYKVGAWGVASSLINSLSIVADQTNVEPDLGREKGIAKYYKMNEAFIAIVDGEDGKVIFSPLVTMVATNPNDEGNGVNSIQVTKNY